MSGTTTVTGASGESITLLNEPGMIVESVAGAGGNYVASIHATGMTSVLEAVFRGNNTAVTGWTTIALDASGNATIPVHFDQNGEYLNLLSADSTTNVVSFPVVLADTLAATTANQTVTLPASGATEVFVTVPDTIIQTGGASTVISGAGHMTLAASGGSQVIFDSVGGDKIAEAPVSQFFGGPSGLASTINAAAGGSDTILAGGAILYNGTGGTNSLMVGGTGAATVTAATNQTLFGGTGGGVYEPGSGNFFFFGGGGADTITGGAGTPTVWGNTNEKLTATNTAAHGIFIAFGNNDSINASTAGGSNSFLVVNQALPVPGGTFSGNTTLVGSSAGGDAFAVFKEPGAAPPAHTIDIQNWQPTDTFFLGNYSTADVNAANAALGGAAVGAGASFTLSDQTTITFLGNHPTVAFS